MTIQNLTIIVLHYYGFKDTEKCLESLKNIKLKDFSKKIIVINNNASDFRSKSIAKQFPRIKIINNKENLGFAEGNNVGIRYALKNEADYILLLNNDTIVKKDFLVQLIKVIKKDKKIGISSPKIYFAPGFEYHKKRYLKKDLGKVIWYAGGIIDWKNVLASHRLVNKVDKNYEEKWQSTDFATGCAILVKKEVF